MTCRDLDKARSILQGVALKQGKEIENDSSLCGQVKEERFTLLFIEME